LIFLSQGGGLFQDLITAYSFISVLPDIFF
jgi:hypothetical protein